MVASQGRRRSQRNGADCRWRRRQPRVDRSAVHCLGSRRARRSPAAPSMSTPCACPACCPERSFAARWRMAASSRSIPALREAFPGVHCVVTADDIRKIMPDPYYGPAFPRPAHPGHRQGPLRGRAGRGRARPRSAYRRGSGAGDHRAVRGAAGRLRRSRGDDLADRRARGASAGRKLCRPQASQATKRHQPRARRQAAARECRQGFRIRCPRLRAYLSHPEMPASRVRAVCVDCRRARIERHHLHQLARSIVSPQRDRAAAALAGEPRAHQGAVRGRRLRLRSSTSSSKPWSLRSRCWYGGR